MARLHVRLTPGARCGPAGWCIDGWGEDAHGRRVLKIRVKAPPVEGKANAALIACLAEVLDLPRSRLSVAAGTTARLKAVDIDTTDAPGVLSRLPPF